MKNRISVNLISLVAVILITALPAYCAPTIKETITKFLYVMGGVTLSSIIIFLGLSIYNKFFVKQQPKNTEENTIFTIPTNIDESIASFIKRNPLR